MPLDMSSRNPFPSPKYENDLSLSGFKPQQIKTYKKPCHIAQTEEPWSRLHDTATLTSTWRSVTHYKPQAPNDSLDFRLKSIYDHHKDLFLSMSQISYQKETMSADHRKGENLEKQDMLENECDNDIRMWVDSKRSSIYSIK